MRLVQFDASQNGLSGLLADCFRVLSTKGTERRTGGSPVALNGNLNNGGEANDLSSGMLGIQE